MLINPAKKGRFNLIPLLVMLYIAAGVPLIHPVLHDHLNHGQTGAAPFAEPFLTSPDQEKEHDCPICSFLATNQWHAASFIPAIAAGEQLGSIASKKPFFPIKTDSKISEPRAPPASTPIL